MEGEEEGGGGVKTWEGEVSWTGARGGPPRGWGRTGTKVLVDFGVSGHAYDSPFMSSLPNVLLRQCIHSPRADVSFFPSPCAPLHQALRHPLHLTPASLEEGITGQLAAVYRAYGIVFERKPLTDGGRSLLQVGTQEGEQGGTGREAWWAGR